MKIFRICFVFHLFVIAGFSHAASIDIVEQCILDAKTYYWLGIADKRDAGSFNKGLIFLERAQSELNAINGKNHKLAEEKRKRLQQQIDQLRIDLEEQRNLSSHAFGGYFPLARFLGVPVFLNPDSLGSFEIIETPLDVGAQRAALKLGDILQSSLLGDTQVAVLVVSPGREYKNMESMARMMLKQFPRVKVHELSSLSKVLSNEELQILTSGNVHPDISIKLFDLFGSRVIAIAMISRINLVDDIHFVRITAQLYRQDKPKPFDAVLIYELVRDKRKAPFIFGLFLLFLMMSGFILFAIFQKRTTGRFPGVGYAASCMMCAFIFGLIGTMAITILFYSFRPDYHTHLGYSLWWIILILLAALWVPSIVFRNIVTRSEMLKTWLKPTGRQRIFFSITSLGASSILCFGLFLYYDPFEAVFRGLACATFFGGTAYHGGAFLDHLDKRSGLTLLISAALLFPLGSYFVVSTGNFFLILLILSANSLLAYIRRPYRAADLLEPLDIVHSESQEIKKVGDLIEASQQPPYFESIFFKDLSMKIQTHASLNGSMWCLTGPGGSGKTAMVWRLIEQIRASQYSSGQSLLVLHGRCREHSNGQIPYESIRDILREYFQINPAADQQAQLLQIDKFLDGVFNKFIPFSGLIFPSPSGECPQANTQEELLQSVLCVFKRLTERHRVVLFIDDLQWVDSGTSQMLKYLHEKLHEENLRNVLFLYTARETEVLGDLFETSEPLDIPPMNWSEQRTLLEQSLNINRDSAAVIVGWTQGGSDRPGNLFWLLKAAEHLARNDGFIFYDGKFSLKPDLLIAGKPPLPREYRESIREELAELQEFETMITAAAAMGIEFDSSVLAQSMSMDALVCLKKLHQLEKRTNLIYDVLEKDGTFAFSSSFALEAVRNELGIETHDLDDTGTRQFIREIHSRIGVAMHELFGDDAILSVAGHFYAAGDRHLIMAATLCIKAAEYCVKLFRFDEARIFLEKTRRRTRSSAHSFEYELKILLCECEIAHMEGKDREANAENCRRVLESREDLTNAHLLIFSRSFYDARDYDVCRKLAGQVFDVANNSIEAAEALHFMAISLPPSSAKERKEGLLSALERFAEISSDYARNQHLRGRILNSLGEAYVSLATTQPDFRQKAIEAFEESIAIKSLPNVQDTPGLALSYGGLGRIFLFLEPVDIDKAVKYFEMDLKFAEQVGDISGRTIMHSMLGHCRLLQCIPTLAKYHYVKSLESSQNTVGRFFSYFGLLKALAELPDDEELKGYCEGFRHFLEETELDDYLRNEIEGYISGVGKSLAPHVRRGIESALKKWATGRQV